MPSFEKLFRKSKGQPVLHNGERLYLADYVPFKEGDVIRITFEQTASEWRQGVKLQAPGTIKVADQRIDASLFLWEDTAPTQTDLVLMAAQGELEVSNIWDTGDGVAQSWHNGAAMKIEALPNGKRYRCNDGHSDEDFDDIVFRLERIDEN